MLKHVGRMVQNKRRIVVAYKTLPNDADHCVVVTTENLEAADHDSLIKLVESPAGQEAEDLAKKISIGFPGSKIAEEIPLVNYNEQQDIKISHPSKQAHLYYGAPIIKRGDPDFLTLYLGNYIFH